MAKDYMRYDLLAQDALRGVVRMALERVQEQGSLPGTHHFYIVFVTSFDGVEMPDSLRERYPTEMPIILQHQFWDLEVADDHFAVSLSFEKLPQRLVIPFKAIRAFSDPSVQFAMQFQVEGQAQLAPAETTAFPARDPDEDGEAAPDDAPEASDEDSPSDGKTGEVVSLDAFRKK